MCSRKIGDAFVYWDDDVDTTGTLLFDWPRTCVVSVSSSLFGSMSLILRCPVSLCKSDKVFVRSWYSCASYHWSKIEVEFLLSSFKFQDFLRSLIWRHDVALSLLRSTMMWTLVWMMNIFWTPSLHRASALWFDSRDVRDLCKTVSLLIVIVVASSISLTSLSISKIESFLLSTMRA